MFKNLLLKNVSNCDITMQELKKKCKFSIMKIGTPEKSMNEFQRITNSHI